MLYSQKFNENKTFGKDFKELPEILINGSRNY